jgi:peptidoglycan/LPS O-acetylase OafA/YrhL
MLKNSGDFKLSSSCSLFLNLLRGLAAQAVVVGHGLSYFGITNDLPYIQNSAVVIFFILSGIVIAYSTFRKPDLSFSSYFVDRLSRIYVGFMAAMFFILAIDWLSRSIFGNGYVYSSAFNVHTFLGNLFMLQDYPLQDQIKSLLNGGMFSFISLHLPITSFGSARPLWTVAIEWWIYLLFGWIVLAKTQLKNRPALFWLILLVFLIVPAFNWINGRGNGLSMMWFMGLLIYLFLSRFVNSLSMNELVLLAGLCLSLAMVRLWHTLEAYDVIYAGLISLFLYFSLYHLQHREAGILQRLEPAIILNAEISYMLYLVHYSLLDFLFLWHGRGGVASLLIGIIISNLVAVGMYLAFDRHYKAVAAWLKRSLSIPT